MKKISQTSCFTHPQGGEVFLFTLRNAKGMEVEISNYGAIIRAIRFPVGQQKKIDLVLGLDTMEDYLSPDYLKAYPYLGAVIGRYGNRIGRGQFTLEGKDYQLASNNGPDHLHGGITGFDKKVWTLKEMGEDPHPWLVLSCLSPDGEEGYPGNLRTEIRFKLNDDNELSYSFDAVTDKTTIVNLTHHSYFNFKDGQGTIRDYALQIGADAILEQDDNFVTTGKLISVAGSAHDFKQMRRIDANWNEETGFDQSFVRNQEGLLQPAAVAECGDTGIRMELFTSEPVVHFYTARWLGPLKGKAGNTYGPYSGFCLETQVHPNAINIPSFPNTVLRPGEKYSTRTVYRFSALAPK